MYNLIKQISRRFNQSVKQKKYSLSGSSSSSVFFLVFTQSLNRVSVPFTMTNFSKYCDQVFPKNHLTKGKIIYIFKFSGNLVVVWMLFWTKNIPHENFLVILACHPEGLISLFLKPYTPVGYSQPRSIISPPIYDVIK